MSNIYTVEIDGQQVDIEGDRPPNEAEARAALSAHAASADPRLQKPTFSPQHTDSIGPTPWYRSNRVPGTSIDLPFNVEDAAEAFPAAAATGAALLATKNPGAASVAGGVAGEAARQLFRRTVGVPQATGIAQRALGLDPNSPEAAAAGLGGEAAAALAGVGASKAAGALGRGAEHSAERSIVRDVLGGARTEREIVEAPALAKRAQAAGIVKNWTKRGRLATAESALSNASGAQDAAYRAAKATGKGVEAGPVLDAIQDELPTSIPGSGAPRKAAAGERRAAGRVLDDELSAIANKGGGVTGTEIPLDTTLGEIDALDAQLKPMYDRGALDPALGKKATQAGRKAFAAQLRVAFPELADARMTTHELMTIRDMAKRVVDGELQSRGGGHQVAGTVGAAAVGRYGPAASGVFSSMAGAAAPLSIPARQLAAKVLSGGAKTAQFWIHAADFAGLNTDDDIVKTAERHRKAATALSNQAKGVVAP